MKPYADDEPPEADERLGELAQLEHVIVAPEPRLDHHLLGVMRPAFDERCGRKHEGFTNLRLDLPQELTMQKMSWIHLVDRNRPQRREVEIAQVLFLLVGRP